MPCCSWRAATAAGWSPPICGAPICALGDFAKADLSRADLRGANLTGMSVYEANLPRAKLDRGNAARRHVPRPGCAICRSIEPPKDGRGVTADELAKLIDDGEPVRKVSLAGADLAGRHRSWPAQFRHVDFSGADLRGAKLGQSNLHPLHLDRRAILEGADLASAAFIECDLTEASLARRAAGQGEVRQVQPGPRRD